MFTTGRIVFTVIFITLFIIAMIYAFRKDMKYEKLWYSGVWKILLGFLIVVLLYYLFGRI